MTKPKAVCSALRTDFLDVMAEVSAKCKRSKEFVAEKIKTDPAYAKEFAEAFPTVDPLHYPLGTNILLQVRTPISRKGSIILHEDVKETEKWNTQVGRVVAIGPMAYRDAETLDLWPEGKWVEEGDFVRFPKYGSDKWAVRFKVQIRPGFEVEQEALFILVPTRDVFAVVTGDPLQVKAYV